MQSLCTELEAVEVYRMRCSLGAQNESSLGVLNEMQSRCRERDAVSVYRVSRSLSVQNEILSVYRMRCNLYVQKETQSQCTE